MRVQREPSSPALTAAGLSAQTARHGHSQVVHHPHCSHFTTQTTEQPYLIHVLRFPFHQQDMYANWAVNRETRARFVFRSANGRREPGPTRRGYHTSRQVSPATCPAGETARLTRGLGGQSGFECTAPTLLPAAFQPFHSPYSVLRRTLSAFRVHSYTEGLTQEGHLLSLRMSGLKDFVGDIGD